MAAVVTHRGGRGLVLGAGGALGAAWTIGALCVLAEVEGYDAAAVDVVLGTSAGSVVAALLGCGVAVGDMAERLDTARPPKTEGTGPVNPFDVHRSLAAIPRPVLLPSNLGLVARTARKPHRHTFMTVAAGLAPKGRGDLRPLAAMIEDASAGEGWPRDPAVWVAAMDFERGRRVVFGRDPRFRAVRVVDAADENVDEIDGKQLPTEFVPPPTDVRLSQAVMASCAAPGFFPPVRIGSRRYVDGGAVSVTNADALVSCGLDEVLILAPMATFARTRPWSATAQADLRLRRGFTARLGTEVARLRKAGARVRVLAPTADDLDVIGLNMMNPRRRREVLERSLMTTRAQLADRPAPPAARTAQAVRRTS